MVELKLRLPDSLVHQLQNEATLRNLPLEEMISAALMDYFYETPDEEIIESLKTGMQEALAGKGRPARDFLDELKHNLREMNAS